MKNQKTIPTNWEIPGNEVRLVLDQENTKILTKHEAIQIAKNSGQDLVLIAQQQNAPCVCKITTLGKLKYELEKNKNRKKPQKTKEIGLHSDTQNHDIQTKLRQAINFFEKGHNVLFRIPFRGREREHSHLGIQLLQNIENQLKNHAQFETIEFSGTQATLKAHPKIKHHNGYHNQNPNQKPKDEHNFL